MVSRVVAMTKTFISWDELHRDCDIAATKLVAQNIEIDYIIGLSRGGVVPARIMAEIIKPKHFLVLGLKLFDGDKRGDEVKITQDIASWKEFDRHDKILIVDDISDGGTTLKYALSHIFRKSGGAHILTACPYTKIGTSLKPSYYSKEYSPDEWIVFPFEKD